MLLCAARPNAPTQHDMHTCPPATLFATRDIAAHWFRPNDRKRCSLISTLLLQVATTPCPWTTPSPVGLTRCASAASLLTWVTLARTRRRPAQLHALLSTSMHRLTTAWTARNSPQQLPGRAVPTSTAPVTWTTYSLNPKGPKTRNVSKPPLHNTIYGSKRP